MFIIPAEKNFRMYFFFFFFLRLKINELYFYFESKCSFIFNFKINQDIFFFFFYYSSDPLPIFFFFFILDGVAVTCFWTIGLAISLEFGDDSSRPTYVGMANTLVSPATFFAPLVGGFLADSFGYPVTFITSAIIGTIAIVTLTILVKDPSS